MKNYCVQICFANVVEQTKYVWANNKTHAKNIGWWFIVKQYGSRNTGHYPRVCE